MNAATTDTQIPDNLFGDHRAVSCYDGGATREHAGQIVAGFVAQRPGQAALCVADSVTNTVAWVVMEPEATRELFVDYCLLATSDSAGQSTVDVWGWGRVTLSRPAGSTGLDIQVQSKGHPDTAVTVGGEHMAYLWYVLGWLANGVGK